MKIENVKIINPNATINNADVIIEKGKIKDIIEKKGEGQQLLIPGFIDIHTHGSGGLDVMDGSGAVAKIARFFPSVGTTTFAPTLMTAPWKKIIKVLKDVSSKEYEGARIEGYHLEGPFISLEKKGAHDPKLLLKGTIELMDEIINVSNGRLWKIVLAPESTPKTIVQYLVDKGIRVSLGHSNARGTDVEDYIKAGAATATHLWNGMSGTENRNPGIAEKFLIHNNVVPELICDFIHVDKDTLKLSIDKKTPDFITAITDSIRPAGMKDGKYESGGLPVIKKGLEIRLENGGSIAGGASTMHDQFKNIVSLGYSLNDAVKMTSANQAKQLKVNRGIIKKGCEADVIIMNKKNYNIEEVILRGEKWK